MNSQQALNQLRSSNISTMTSQQLLFKKPMQRSHSHCATASVNPHRNKVILYVNHQKNMLEIISMS